MHIKLPLISRFRWLGSLLLIMSTCTTRSTDRTQINQVDSLKTGFDVNDLSVLFPMPKSSEQLGELLKGDSRLLDGTLLWDESIFKQVIASALKKGPKALEMTVNGNKILTEGPGIDLKFANFDFTDRGDQLNSLGNWRVVSFRFDPCAPVLLPLIINSSSGQKSLDPRCLTQIRLVLQPVAPGKSEFSNTPTAPDFAAHLIFGFPVSDATILAKKLLALKTETSTGKALGVHPAMAKSDDFSKEFSRSMRVFLQNTLSAKNLQAVAFLGLANTLQPWVFFAGRVTHSADGMPLKFEMVPQKFGANLVAKQVFDTSDRAGTGNAVAPKFGDTRISTAPFFKQVVEENRMTLDSKVGNQKAADVIAEIENPDLSSLLPQDQDNTMHRDCVSCHTSTALINRLQEDENGQVIPNNIDFFINSPKRFSAFKDPKYKGITGLVNSKITPTGPWDIRNFGYVAGSDHPSISMRTLNETIAVTALTNELLGLENPAKNLNCSELLVWKCLLNKDNEGNCMKQHCSPKTDLEIVSSSQDDDNVLSLRSSGQKTNQRK